MDILMPLAFVAVLILVFISFQVSRIIGLQREVVKSIGMVAICCDNVQRAVENSGEMALKINNDIANQLEDIGANIRDIKFTADIFEKYRLPDASERKELDTINAEITR